MTWFRCGMKKASEDSFVQLVERTITSVSNDTITTVGASAFAQCKSLTSVDLPNVTTIGGSSFLGCSYLVNVDMPKLTSITGSAFNQCVRLVNINIPEVTAVQSNAFYGCNDLVAIDFPKLTSISTQAFSSAHSLATITIHTSSMATLDNIDAFNGTNFAAGGAGGTVYVPSELVSTYEADATWAALLALNANNSIQAITP